MTDRTDGDDTPRCPRCGRVGSPSAIVGPTGICTNDDCERGLYLVPEGPDRNNGPLPFVRPILEGVAVAFPFAAILAYAAGDVSEALYPFVVVFVVWVVFGFVRLLASRGGRLA